MRKRHHGFILCLLTCLFVQCRTAQPTARKASHTAIISAEGLLTCFEPGLSEGKLWCEASAVVQQQGRIYLANDKDMLGAHPSGPRSSVFYYNSLTAITGMSLTGQQLPTYLQQPLLRSAHKFEEFAQTPDRSWTFLITAFDRIKPNSPDFDGYNMLLAWRPGEEGAAQVVGAEPGEETSLALRRKIQTALGGSPYFKIEGLAATDTHLWFGVREQGERYDKFDYRITILSAPYRVEFTIDGQEKIVLGTLTSIQDFNVGDVDTTLPKPLAISSLEYDSIRTCFWLMTSYEQGDTVGAYLWTITEKVMMTNGRLQLVRTPDGKPLAFKNKAEDMTFIDPNTLFIIHDDDRIRTRVNGQERQPNQAAYSIVRVGR